MRRGDVYLAALDPVVGSEVGKSRPAIIVSNDANNEVSTIVTLVPLTSNLSRVYPFEIRVPTDQSGLRMDSKAMPQQVRTVSKSRLLKRLGAIPDRLMADIDRGLKLHLSLD
jgi:mRNA interferase MazF